MIGTLKTSSHRLLAALALFSLVACTDGGDKKDDDPSAQSDPPSTGNFELRTATPTVTLIEGDEAGIDIPLSLARSSGHTDLVQLTIGATTVEDTRFVTSSFTRENLTPGTDNSEVNLRLAIGDLPILPQQREFIVRADDGRGTHQITLTVNIQPTDAPDVYLLVGQSNMVGFSGDGTKQASVGGPDEPNPRILQLNVRENDGFSIFRRAADFTSLSSNIADPAIVQAEDPLD